MHEVLVNRLGGLSLPRKSVVRLTDRPDMTLDVYRGRKTTMQQQQFTDDSCLKDHMLLHSDKKAHNSNSCDRQFTEVFSSEENVVNPVCTQKGQNCN